MRKQVWTVVCGCVLQHSPSWATQKVDTNIDRKLPISLDITFPHLRCSEALCFHDPEL